MRTPRRLGLLAAALIVALSATARAQLGTRPADEWIKVLETPERIKALRIDEVVSALHLHAGAVVADLGAGSGPFEPALAKAVSPGGQVYAVDIDSGFFPYIRAKAAAAGVTNVQTVLGEFSDPKLPARDVDVAFMHDVLHHIQDRGTYFTNLVKYLKPDARIAIVDFNPAQSPHKDDPSLQVSKEDAGRWLKEAGFTHSEEVPLAPDKWFVIYSRK